jgi:phosphotransferase system, enzyme I, PtsP
MERQYISILEEIFQIIAESAGPELTLNRIGALIAERFAVDVCSVYVYQPEKKLLTLKATVGLKTDQVDAISMGVDQGLTGLVIETMKPVLVTDPASHPRYRYYAGTGEEDYRTFLGIPLKYHQQILGVLVIQTRARDGIPSSHVPIFEYIASQISATVAYTGLLDNQLRDRFGPERDPTGGSDAPDASARPLHHRNYLRGNPVSPGVADGYAHYLPESIDFDQVRSMITELPEVEKTRMQNAISASAAQIRRVMEKARDVSAEESAVIDAHLMFLSDPSLKRKLFDRITSGQCAEYALKQVIFEYVDIFRGFSDSYLSERAADVLDIGRRVLANLIGAEGESPSAFGRPTIIIASDISPVDLMAFHQPELKGIVLSRGGPTSHTVILAKSFEIPAVIGVDDVIETVRQGDHLIVDGMSGFVFTNPPAEIRQEYQRRQGEEEKLNQQLSSLKDMPAVTRDGFRMHLGANIGLLSDMELVKKYGAEYIGLYRTEFPFLLRKNFPTEEEQFLLYRTMLQNADGRPVTIRTFDAGGDKVLPYLDIPKEDNPFLGWRSIRLSLDLDETFRIQIRAILRASSFGRANILFPMITCVSEVRRIREILAWEKKELSGREEIYDENIGIGIMVEVPGAIGILDRLLRYVDFVSIGTNDLIQYMLAVDRNNKKVAGLYNVLHPSVIAAVADIVNICNQNGREVNICGEAASRPECQLLFAGMGADRISMNASAVPAAKAFIRSIRRVDAQAVLEEAICLEDAGAVSRMIQDFQKTCPETSPGSSSAHGPPVCDD